MNLEGTHWQLSAMRSGQEESAPVAAAARVTLQFQGGRINGSAGCNRFFGAYAAEGNKLAITAIGTTRMACPEPQMTLERAYLAGLHTITTFESVADQLHLADAMGDTTLIFTRVPPEQ